MVTTVGKDAVIRWVEETTPGTFPTNPALKLFSKETLSAKLSLDVSEQESLDIGNPDIEEYYRVQSEYGIEVTCHLYDVDRILDFADRNGDTSLKAYSLEYIPDVSAATKHYYRGSGWRISSIELSVGTNAAWEATLVFVGGRITAPVTTDPGIGTGSREAKTAFAGFSIKTFTAAAVTLNGSTWGAIVNNFSLTIENDYETPYTMGSAEPVVNIVVGSTRRLNGSCDLSLENGAKDQWDRVVANSAHTIEIPFGGTGEQLLTLTGVKFPSIEVESNTEDNLLMGGQDFRAASYTRGTVP